MQEERTTQRFGPSAQTAVLEDPTVTGPRSVFLKPFFFRATNDSCPAQAPNVIRLPVVVTMS